MKNFKSIALALVAFVSFATTAQTGKKVDASKSTINWVGKKVTGSHEGTITLKEGTLIFKGKKLVGGNFTVDMTTINTTDLEGKGKANLDGHLKSDDNWEIFLDKIGKRDIQYYIKNGEWYLIFNSSPSLERVVEVKIPQYFLEGDDVTTAR